MAKTAPLSSMTGFARQAGSDAGMTWSWEVKSVNSRSLDIRCRVPQGYESLDAAARGLAPKHLARGNVQLSLTASRASAPLRVQVNREILDQVISLTRELQDKFDSDPPRLDGLLAIRGVIETVEEEETAELRETREAAMLQDLDRVLQSLAGNRQAEGARLQSLVGQHLDTMEGLVEAAAACAAAQPEALRARLKEQLEELLGAAPALPEERLAQEAALLITKADVREELDRLVAHIAAARELLDGGGAVGRRLDFLCQELNREANTLCSKSPDVELTRVGLDLKGAIEQLREQVQNLE